MANALTNWRFLEELKPAHRRIFPTGTSRLRSELILPFWRAFIKPKAALHRGREIDSVYWIWAIRYSAWRISWHALHLQSGKKTKHLLACWTGYLNTEKTLLFSIQYTVGRYEEGFGLISHYKWVEIYQNIVRFWSTGMDARPVGKHPNERWMLKEQCTPQQVSKTLLRFLGQWSTDCRIKTFKMDIFLGIDSNVYFQKTAYWIHLHMFRFGNPVRSLHIVRFSGCLYQL